MPVGNYAPLEVIVTFAKQTISGFAEDTFVQAERASPLYTKKVGADGSGARARHNDESGKVTITLLATSPSNDFLSAQVALDKVGAGTGTLMVKDLNGTTLLHAETAWIAEYPKPEFAKEVSEREWVFETLKLDMLLGGAPAV